MNRIERKVRVSRLLLNFKNTLIGVSLLLLSLQIFAQNSAVTPAKNSPVRKAVLTIVKKKYPKAKKEDIFKVQGNWARVVYDQSDDGGADVNVILRKTGAAWKIVWDFNVEGEGDDVNDHFKGIPKGISNPWNN